MRIISKILVPGILLCGGIITPAHAFRVCGMPIEAVPTPDGAAWGIYIQTTEPSNDEYEYMYYSCWDGDIFESARQEVFNYDYNYGYVCLDGDEYPGREFEYANVFVGISNCTIDTQSYACHWSQYWDGTMCQTCENGGSGTGYDENGAPNNDGHKNTTCHPAPCTWSSRYDADNQTCIACPDNSSATGFRMSMDGYPPIEELHYNSVCHCRPGDFMTDEYVCDKCPAPGEPLIWGVMDISQCMLPAGHQYTDISGTYVMTQDCMYQP